MRCARFCSNKTPIEAASVPSRRSRADLGKGQLPQSTVAPTSSGSSRRPQTQQRTRSMPGRFTSNSSSLNSIGPKPVQSESRVGGRHPHPPSANNTKLKHKCPFEGCPWRFATPYKLRRHIKSHTKETPFLCKECGRGFSVRYNLLMHIQTIHSQPQRHKCPIRGCKEAFHSQPRLNGHLRKVHKKDWKSLQEKGEIKKESGSSRSSSTSSVDSAVSKSGSRLSSRHECPECKKECGSQAKLNSHMRSHSSLGEKPFKCSFQECDKAFTTRDKLTKHLETHKNSKQYCCPHENCNRIFLRQSHLRNHLKIHTQGHFVCPVLDCDHKFASESEYNEHLNTHINYGHRCPHKGCEQSFPTQKRLELHCRAVHSSTANGNAEKQSPLVLHGARTPLSLPTASPSTVPIILQAAQPPKSDILNYVDKEIIENVDLPGLTPEDIEIVLSENSDWSVEQMERFFHSAIDLSEIEAKLFSAGGYESDSGYSTYDVSPITSTAPLHFNHGPPYSFPSALTPIDSTPLITLPSGSPSFPLSNVVATSLPPDSASSTTDSGFFSPFTSLAQDGFCTQPCPIFPPFSQPQDYTPAVCFADAHTIPTSVSSFSSEFTDLLDSNSTAENPAKLTGSEITSSASHMTGRRSSDGQISAMSYSNGALDHPGLIEYRSLPDLGKLKKEVNGDPSQQSFQLETVSIKQESDPSTNTYACPGSSACAIEGPQIPSPHPTCEDNGINSSYLSNLQLPPNLANLPGSTLQSLLSMCSQMPVLSRLLASSNNPAVFLVAISTALSTLTKPVQGNSNGSSEGETAATNPAVKSEPASAPTLDITQLQSVVAKLGISQLEKMAGITSATAVHPNSQAAASTQPSIPTSQSFAQQERTVFASVLPNAAERLPLLPPHAQNGFYFPNGVGVGAYNLDQLSYRSMQRGHHSASVNAKSSAKNVPKRHGAVEMKSKQKKPKQQWPRSMNQANLMAFKEHILNKLKKVQKTGDTCNQNGGENSSPPSGKAEASSKPYEHRVTYERNHSSESRCHSEPADFFCCLTRSPSFSLHPGHNANDVNSTTTSSSKLQMSGLLPLESECNDLLSDFHFNPDALLSSAVLPLPDRMLDELTDANDLNRECFITDCAMESDDDKLQQLIGAENTTQAQDTMDIECVSDLLSETKSPSTGASSLDEVSMSSDSFKPEPTSPHASQQLYLGLPLSESQKLEVNKAAEALKKTVGSPTYTFPELNSIHGSLDDLRPAEIEDKNSFRMHIAENLDSILQTQHDPLIGGSSSSEPFEI